MASEYLGMTLYVSEKVYLALVVEQECKCKQTNQYDISVQMKKLEVEGVRTVKEIGTWTRTKARMQEKVFTFLNKTIIF